MSACPEGRPVPGSITWTEIPATDMARVQKFYSDVFGWTYDGMAPMLDDKGSPIFVMFSRGHTNGGFVKVEPEQLLSAALHPGNGDKKCLSVRATITVESVDESLKKVEEAGGKLYIPKVELPNNMGFVAYFTDSEGNVQGLWSM
ncbi:hypothetical protein ONS95_013042 [Cadophora gregata]|uniref:uncharacterized protein n=1 Tax=Cadophora gregata TaxID=51156 RepID=UPI0026DBD02B|nr:uncharacterized protein ONS95_013042 [Cadophora gregata]KAK0100969.1 hypothetical protein ONS96_006201 [Cadophora gregata f. sp. sojae]KAK0116005.1 hypothetical protein ONS95_013042 [Cadophora gregata]